MLVNDLNIKSKFPLGNLYMTRCVAMFVEENPKFAEFVHSSLTRHAQGDYGDLNAEDIQSNEEALQKGLRIFSSYKMPESLQSISKKLWIITEWNREMTTILLPEEY